MRVLLQVMWLLLSLNGGVLVLALRAVPLGGNFSFECTTQGQMPVTIYVGPIGGVISLVGTSVALPYYTCAATVQASAQNLDYFTTSTFSIHGGDSTPFAMPFGFLSGNATFSVTFSQSCCQSTYTSVNFTTVFTAPLETVPQRPALNVTVHSIPATVTQTMPGYNPLQFLVVRASDFLNVPLVNVNVAIQPSAALPSWITVYYRGAAPPTPMSAAGNCTPLFTTMSCDIQWAPAFDLFLAVTASGYGQPYEGAAVTITAQAKE